MDKKRFTVLRQKDRIFRQASTAPPVKTKKTCSSSRHGIFSSIFSSKYEQWTNDNQIKLHANKNLKTQSEDRKICSIPCARTNTFYLDNILQK